MGKESRGRVERGHKCPRWGAKRQAATFVAEESDINAIQILSRAGGTLASALPSEGVHALVRCALALLFTALALLLTLAPAQAEKNLARPPGTTRYGAMVHTLKSLLAYDKAHEKRMTLSSLGHSVRGRTLWMVKLGSGRPKRVFYLCRQHGHEPASTEGALAFMNALVKADGDTPLAGYLKTATVYIVPMANPDGSEAFLRHNAHDVDINRDWIKRTQPETRALYLAISRLHPDLLTDQHELYPDDTRPDFTEVASAGSGATAQVIATDLDAQTVVSGAMQAEGYPLVSHQVTDTHPARLAHRFSAIVLGVPTLLFETNRLTGTGRTVEKRAAAQETFMLTVLRYAAGDRDALVSEAAADTAAHPSSPAPQPPNAKGTD